MTIKNEPLISVIVPIYHVEQYLRRCIDSIIGQTYKNLEIILVDDGSDDGCPAICDEYARKDNRIVVIHKENGGVSDARNNGLDAAKGEYIGFVDPDDYIHRDMYRILMDTILKDSADACICSYKYVYDGREKETDTVFDGDISEIIKSGNEIQYLYYNCDRKLELTVPWNKLYKKEVFRDLRYPKGKIFEDEATTFKILYRCQKVCLIDLPLYYYLQRNDSIIGVMNGLRDSKVVEAYLERIDFYQKEKEESLWCKAVMHCLHMMCYMQSNITNKANSDINILNAYRTDLMKRINGYRSAYKKLSKCQKIEIMIFRISSSCYYWVWKLLKKS